MTRAGELQPGDVIVHGGMRREVVRVSRGTSGGPIARAAVLVHFTVGPPADFVATYVPRRPRRVSS